MVVQGRQAVRVGQGRKAPEDDQSDGRHAASGRTWVVVGAGVVMSWVA